MTFFDLKPFNSTVCYFFIKLFLILFHVPEESNSIESVGAFDGNERWKEFYNRALHMAYVF